MLEPKNIKEDLKRCRLSGADIRLAYERQSCCSKNCMRKLIQGSLGSTSSSKKSSFGGSVHNRSNRSASSSIVDDDTTFDGGSLYCQQIGIPTSSIPILEFDKFIEEVRRPLFALTAGTTSKEEANDQIRYYLVQHFTENRIGDPDNRHNFVYQYQLHSLSRGVITVCKTTYVIITGISVTAIRVSFLILDLQNLAVSTC